MPLAGSIKNYPPLYANEDGYNSRYLNALTIQTGSVTFTVQPQKAYGIGNGVKIFNSANKWMVGDVTAYDAQTGSLTVNVTGIAGSGSASDWYITQSGPQGVQGIPGVNAQSTGSITTTGNITLATTYGAVQVNPAGPGYYATLPAGTSFPAKLAQAYNIVNISEYDYGIRDSTGQRLGWIRAKSGTNISCIDNTTAAGVWGIDNASPMGVVGQHTSLTPYPGSNNFDTGSRAMKFTLDSTYDLLVWAIGGSVDTTAIYATTVSKTSGVFNIPTLLTSTSSTWCVVAGPTANQAIIFSGNSSGMSAYLLTVNLSTGAISSTTSTGGTAAQGNNGGASNLVATRIGNTNSYAVSVTNSALVYVTGYLVTGTTGTYGTTQNVGNISGNSSFTQVYKKIYSINNTVGAVIFVDNTDARQTVRAFTISGNAVTPAGTGQVSGLVGGWYKWFDALPDGRIPFIGWNSTYSLWLATVSADGATITLHASSNVFSANTPDLNNVDFWAVSSSKMYLLAKVQSQQLWQVTILTTSGTTITTSQITQIGNARDTSFSANNSTGAILYADDTTLRISIAGNAIANFTVTGSSASLQDFTMAANHKHVYMPAAYDFLGQRDQKTIRSRDGTVLYVPQNGYGFNQTNIEGYAIGKNTIRDMPPVGNSLRGSIIGDPGEMYLFSSYNVQRIETI